MIKTKIAVISALLMTLIACTGETVNDVKYYKEHDQERISMLEKCRNNALQDEYREANCKNSSRARTQISIEIERENSRIALDRISGKK